MKKVKRGPGIRMMRGWSMVLSFLLVASMLPLPSLVQPSVAHAEAGSEAESTTVTGAVYPGGVKNGLISWVDIEDSMNLAEDGISITTLTDLTDLNPDVSGDNVWNPIDPTKPNSFVSGAINFNGGILINSTRGYYTRTHFNTTDTTREVFSIQGPYTGVIGGFPWNFGGEGTGSQNIISNTSIASNFGNAGSGNELKISGNQFVLGQADILNVLRTADTLGIFLNGTKLGERVPVGNVNFNKASAAGGYYIGAAHNNRFNGLVTETIIYNRVLEAYEKNKVNSYLALKYGITLNNDYVASDWDGAAGTAFWDTNSNTAYNNRVTGIGRDDLGAQNQKQSKSQGNGANVTISLGDSVAATNMANTETFEKDKSFFVFGDNGKEVSFEQGYKLTNDESIAIKTIERVYKVQKTNWDAGDRITLQVDKIDVEKGYPLYLIVSSSGTFDTETTYYPVNQTDGTVILTDSDIGDGNYFTFGSAYPLPDSAQLALAEVDGADHSLSLTFDREIALGDLAGFAITVGDAPLDLTGAGYRVDPNDKKKLIIDLSEEDLSSGEAITVSYDGTGTLRDLQSGVSADAFKETLNAINKVALQNKIEEAAGITNEGYTDTSWQALQDALEAANIALAKADATQAEVNTALNNLQTAIAGLVKSPPNAEGGSFIEGTNTITIDFDRAVKFDLSGGGSFAEGFKVTVGGTEVTVVNAAVDSTDPTKVILTLPDGTDLSAKETVHVSYEKAKGHLVGDSEGGVAAGDFEFDVKDPFAAALTVTEPIGITNDLQPAVTGTAPKDAESVVITLTDSEGKPVKTNEVLTIDPVTGAWTFDAYEADLAPGVYTVTVTATKGGQVATEVHTFTVVNKTALQAEVDEAAGYNEKDWSSETWQTYQDALEAAKNVLAKDEATQKEVDDTLAALEAAQAGLKKAAPIPSNPGSFEGGVAFITIPFDRALALDGTGDEADGFTVTYVDEFGNPGTIEVTSAAISGDNKDRITLNLAEPLASGWNVTVAYDGEAGHLKGEGEEGSPVADFSFELNDPFAAALQITEPGGNTSDKTPAVSGSVHADADELTVTMKDAQGNIVDVAGELIWNTGDSAWSYDIKEELEPGTYTIEVTAVEGGRSVTTTRTFTITANVDKTALQNRTSEINNEISAGTLKPEDYTPETWAKLQEKLQAALGVLGDENATQEQVDAALQALNDSRNALIRQVGLSIVPSTGTIQPAVTDAVYDYTMSVSNNTSQIRFTVAFNPEATITVNGRLVENGQTSDAISLREGKNEITIVITEQDGSTRTYTITVTRDEKSSSSSGGKKSSGSSSNNTSNSTAPQTQTIVVDVVIGGDEEADITKVPIERTSYNDGHIVDKVTFNKAKAQETVDKALKTGKDVARIIIPDEKDEVSEVNLQVPADTVALLQENAIAFEMYNPNVFIQVPADSLKGLTQDFYFRLVPVKDKSERDEIEDRARTEEVVRKWAADDNIKVVARPMTIETNLPSRPVTLTLPLKGVELPDNASARAAFLKQLGIFIEHSNGEKEVVAGKAVTMPDGQLGLQFSVNHFSTFTIIDFNNGVTDGQHTPYIQGFPDGKFKPLENVTRGQLAAMIARNLGYVEGSYSGEAPFSDVPVTSWQAGVVAFVKEQGIMQGLPDGSFMPNQAVTRAEIATVMANYRKLAALQGQTSFNDIARHWAQGNINAVREAGLIEGFQDGSFKPNAYASRAEAVVMLNRMFERGPLYGVTAPTFPDVPATHWAFNDVEEAATTHSYIIDEEQKEVIAE
ncbi:hypothetical protein EHV15_10385 [Paenibacillus oralis]|uniref:SLH domain-containing protein n=1 Tax=Paenibacillus oralis TaxID=2490856 RepID=A0A3P3U3X5_9BACL|nr:S-layer homology domain-containing protein [Paenibacillus oralis]RRJ63283.1 hypothetical protein EHV15_10385 [Paenibacillus oralis]